MGEKVYLRAVPDYDLSRIKKVIREGLEEFGLTGSPLPPIPGQNSWTA